MPCARTRVAKHFETRNDRFKLLLAHCLAVLGLVRLRCISVAIGARSAGRRQCSPRQEFWQCSDIKLSSGESLDMFSMRAECADASAAFRGVLQQSTSEAPR